MSAKPFDTFELMDAFIARVRVYNEHITSEYKRQCANSSAGSTGDPEGFLNPIPRQSATTPSTPATDTTVSVLHPEDNWWKQQNSDARYLAEMQEQLRQWEDDER